MHPRQHAQHSPQQAAVIMTGSGRSLSYAALVERSDRLAQVLAASGLRQGDGIACWIPNDPAMFESAWACLNSGLYFTSVSTLLSHDEAAYVIDNCDARVLITSTQQAQALAAIIDRLPKLRRILIIDGTLPGAESYEAALSAAAPEPPPAGSIQGALMLYSSGTTGSPKGIKPLLTGISPDESPPLSSRLIELFGFDTQTIYLSTAPLYHTAPLKFNLTTQIAGGTCIVMDRFDAESALMAIERHRVTHSQWVPTMFVRLLRLPQELRDRYDTSSQRAVIHAAAPCPVDIKQQMIDWWGPVLFEYYAGTESNGMCSIDSREWLQRPGSVGRSSRGDLHIMSEDGETELAAGEPGVVYFGGGVPFEYHNDPDKTARGRNRRGWTSIGDVGYVDTEGYLYLTDRRDDVIISGGVNIYPQEIEAVLASHAGVADAAVIGVPNAEFGEEVKAVIQPLDPLQDCRALEAELVQLVTLRLGRYKSPRSYDFVDTLPRLPTGKLLRRLIRQQYWGGSDSALKSLAQRLAADSAQS